MTTLIDLTGKKFDRLFVLHRVENNKFGKTLWRCECDCGKKVTVIGQLLRKGNTRSCGCYNADKNRDLFFKDITNKRFGKLLVIKFEHIDKNKKTMWLCKCDCGNEKIIAANSLANGRTSSCGCTKFNPITTEIFEKYGIPDFGILYGMYKSIANKRNLSFNLNHEEFLKLTLGNCFYCGIKPNYIVNKKSKRGFYIYNGIDRIDSDKGYFPSNVVTCCRDCNFAKRKMGMIDFYNFIEKINNNFLNNYSREELINKFNIQII